MNVFIQSDKMRFTHCEFEGHEHEQEAAMLPATDALRAVLHSLWTNTQLAPEELEKMRDLIDQIHLGVKWHETPATFDAHMPAAKARALEARIKAGDEETDAS